MWNGINARKFPRIKTTIEIEIFGRSAIEHITARTENVGSGGVSFISARPFDKFEKVRISLHLDDKKRPVECFARVVWIVEKRTLHKKARSYDVGVEFIDLSDNDCERLRKFTNGALRKERKE